MSKPEIRVYQIHQAAFSFLGNENIITESSDFGAIWGNYFKMGGYEVYPKYWTI